jgi:prepilin-type N-terminal cleavage/methylation domain-containing protein
MNRPPRAFSLLELLVVMVVILILIAILLPVYRSVKNAANRTSTREQLNIISTACELYKNSFGDYPGWFGNAELTESGKWDKFTGTENLALSLLGRVVQNGDSPAGADYWPTGYANPDNLEINLDKVGSGPASNPLDDNPYVPEDRFYSPKPREIHPTQGTDDTQNPFPEIVDQFNGLPILYMRATPGIVGRTLGSEDEVVGVVANFGAFNRRHAMDYLETDTLLDTGGSGYDQLNNSLFSDSLVTADEADDNMAWVCSSSPSAKNTDQLVSGFVLISAGIDGIFFDRLQNTNTANADRIGNHAAVDDFDDVVLRGGQRR